MNPFYQYRATITRIIDGDTVDAICDLGFRINRNDRFRLYGINTPERGRKGSVEATAYLTSMIPVGASVLIRSHKPETMTVDSFGRWVAEIFLPDGTNVNDAMIEAGHAVSFMRDKN
jgi:micrococcal nuclease